MSGVKDCPLPGGVKGSTAGLPLEPMSLRRATDTLIFFAEGSWSDGPLTVAADGEAFTITSQLVVPAADLVAAGQPSTPQSQSRRNLRVRVTLEFQGVRLAGASTLAQVGPCGAAGSQEWPMELQPSERARFLGSFPPPSALSSLPTTPCVISSVSSYACRLPPASSVASLPDNPKPVFHFPSSFLIFLFPFRPQICQRRWRWMFASPQDRVGHPGRRCIESGGVAAWSGKTASRHHPLWQRLERFAARHCPALWRAPPRAEHLR